MWLITPPRHDDARGYFAELYRADLYRRAGVPVEFVQANQSSSRPGVLRGLHYQLRHPQDKLIAVSRGCIWDVAVDLRWGSPTFGQWAAHELSAENRRQVFVPAGFAHGFCVLGEEPADVIYFCSRFYDPTDEYGVRWDDPRLRIPWPVARPLVSPKDAHLPSLADLPADDLPAL
ncbi:MAG: dTDP-4-dehydrorhamnose 3,5-epimerase [Kiritimatiellae bacterium]|nr:dTDP-4-dehydrorhamnose 3,5-epimerase [Kiritimatiellia bacterium]